nr:hypothetical protein [Ruegeria atlantica]
MKQERENPVRIAWGNRYQRPEFGVEGCKPHDPATNTIQYQVEEYCREERNGYLFEA